MIYPSVGQYTEAIKLAEQSPEDYFATKTTLRPILGADGNPVMSSGNFAVVFKMQDQTDGKIYALKCFTRDQEGRNESYRLIADELQYVESEYLTKIQYLEKELFVDTGTDDTEFPVLLMDWVEGETLDKYIKNHINEPACLNLLVGRFCMFADWLLKQPFAHGDLKPDNIIVKDDGSLVIVDYDGMYVPKMRGQKARELGSPDFRHPQRTEDDFDEHIDDFAIVMLLLTIRAIALNPNILEDCNAKDCVLLHTQDYTNLAQSAVNQKLQELIGDSDFARLYAVFVVVLAEKIMDDVFRPLFASFAILNTTDDFVENLSTEVTDEDIKEGVEDRYGIIYSQDGLRLLKCTNKLIKKYTVKKGTLYLCNEAFKECSYLQSINIPDSVIMIGDSAFINCASLRNILIPNSINKIGEYSFYGCNKLRNITLPYGITRIEQRTFYNCKSLQSFSIPNSVISIGKYAFAECETLQMITIPDSVTTIGVGFITGSGVNTVICHSHYYYVLNDALYSNEGKCLHSYFGSLRRFEIPKNVTQISDSAFEECDSLQIVNVPEGITNIGNRAFCNCTSLRNIIIPNGVKSIGDYTFCGCLSLQNVSIPNSVTSIGFKAFGLCRSLRSVIIPSSVSNIRDMAFGLCYYLQTITISSGVTDIGNNAFLDCRSIQCLTIPDTVTNIGKHAFENCESLQNITLIDGITNIGDSAFEACKSLQSIIIPKSVTNIGAYAFKRCFSLQNIVISNANTIIDKTAFWDCRKLISVKTINGEDSKFSKFILEHKNDYDQKDYEIIF